MTLYIGMSQGNGRAITDTTTCASRSGIFC